MLRETGCYSSDGIQCSMPFRRHLRFGGDRAERRRDGILNVHPLDHHHRAIWWSLLFEDDRQSSPHLPTRCTLRSNYMYPPLFCEIEVSTATVLYSNTWTIWRRHVHNLCHRQMNKLSLRTASYVLGHHAMQWWWEYGVYCGDVMIVSSHVSVKHEWHHFSTSPYLVPTTVVALLWHVFLYCEAKEAAQALSRTSFSIAAGTSGTCTAVTSLSSEVRCRNGGNCGKIDFFMRGSPENLFRLRPYKSFIHHRQVIDWRNLCSTYPE